MGVGGDVLGSSGDAEASVSPSAALLETVQRLWPDADEVVVGRDRSRGDDAMHRLAFVPNARSARVLAPVDRRAASHAVQRYSAAITIKEAAQRVLLSAAVRVGQRWLLPDHIEVRGGGDSIVSHLSAILGESVTVSLGIGTARANRKPVLGVFDRSGRPIAFVKIGDTPVSTAHVSGEAAALERIGAIDWSVVEPPRLLHSGTWRGMHVLVMTALATGPWQGRNSEWRFPDDALAELATTFAERRTPLAATPMWRNCRAAVGRLRDTTVAARLQEALDQTETDHGGVDVEVAAWHGDFTPWNLGRRRGRVQLWDWERFATGVPVGLDRLHFGVQTHTRGRGFTPETIAEGLRRGGAALPGSRRAALERGYLASLATRYLLSAQNEGGDVIAGPACAVLETLQNLSPKE